MKKIFPALPILMLALLLASCQKHEPSLEQNSGINTVQAGTELAGIKTAPARLSAITRQVKMLGQISATEKGSANVTSPLNGVILDPLVKLGDKVAKGEPLAIISNIYGQTSLQILKQIEGDEIAVSSARDNASQARAELVNAAIDLRRKRGLFRGGVAARSDVEDADERYAKAVAVARDTGNALKIAMIALNRDKAIFHDTELSGAPLPQNLTPVPLSGKYPGAPGSVLFYIRAPITGTVTSYTMSAGLSVSPGAPLASITNTEEVYADANAYESDLPFVHSGDPVMVETSAFPGEKFRGNVDFVGRQMDPGTRTVVVRSLIRNPGGILRPGMFASVALVSGHVKSTLVVPDSAVLIHGENRYLFVETAPDHFEKRPVRVGIMADGEAEILNGVKAGEKVVTSGNLLLEGQE